MGANQGYLIGKADLLEMLKEARELEKKYCRENKRLPGKSYRVPSVDEIALRLFERREGCVVVSLTLKHGDLNVHTIGGAVSDDDVVEYLLPGVTQTYTLKNFSGTTVARFAETVAGVIKRRKENPDSTIAKVMPPLNRTGRTLTHVQQYACR